MPDRKPLFAPLSNTTFRDLWIANNISNLGGLIQGVGAAWMMTSISASENMVALVQASTTLPIMLFSIVSGALADNFQRRQVILSAQIFMFVVSVLLAVFAYLGWIGPWMLLAFTFLLGCGTALNNPAWQASVGDMVPRQDVAGAVSLNSMGFNMTRSVGPALGGAIVAFGGAAAAFAANAVSYLALIYASSAGRIRKRRAPCLARISAPRLPPVFAMSPCHRNCSRSSSAASSSAFPPSPSSR